MAMFKTLAFVALGGSLGAVSRYLLGLLTRAWWGESFPHGTLLVNVLGCLIIGILAGVGLKHVSLPLQQFAIVGVLGSLTTFSTFGHDTLELFQRQPLLALGNIGANVIAGLAAVALGYWLFHQA
jgi:CrcB protein